jgi:HEPN domain-containing protein
MEMNDEILAIKDIILKTVDCEKVYLFGSYAYGTPREDSDYDIYIVVKDDSKNPLLVMEDVSWSIYQDGRVHTGIDLLGLRKSQFVDRSTAHTIEKTVVEKECCCMTNKVLKEQMLVIAKDDLESAQTLFEHTYPKKLAIICYHCQQCAEKAMKSYLHCKEVDPPKSHDLNLLCALCTEQDPSFSTIAPLCTKLTVYGSASRYPSERELDETIATTNITRARQIYGFCESKITAETPSEK